MNARTPSIARGLPEEAPRPLPRTLNGLIRRGLEARLRRFSSGALTLVDGDSSARFGDPAAELKATLEVRNPSFYKAVAFGGAIGAAEAYIHGQWQTDDLVALIRIFARNQKTFTPTERRVANALRPFKRLYHYLRHNSPAGSRRNIAAHYDLGEQFYALFLDPTMTYSCGIFPSSDATLEEASREKLDRICRKLELGPEDHVLEIGTGWGSFAQHAAEVYGCRVTTTTISKRQHEYATRRMAARGLEGRVTVLSTDYRQLTGVYDKLVAIEMIEAVGHRYLPTFLATCERLLKPEGLAALQAITIAEEHYERYRKSVDFIQHYVFPGSCLISMDHFRESLKRSTRLDLAGCEDITPHYARTLRAWRERFMARREEVHALGFPEPFLRLWEYYLAYCEAGFLEERIGDVQLLLAGPARSPSGSAAPGDEARSAC